jgi:hypothetical protein
MSQNAFMALLFVLVLIGLAIGLWGGLWLSGHLPDSMPDVLQGVLTLLITFACTAAGVGLLYFVAFRLERHLRRRKRGQAADASFAEKDRVARKRRKKRG